MASKVSRGSLLTGLGVFSPRITSRGIVYEAGPGGNTVWATGLGSINDSMLGIAYLPPLGFLVSEYSGIVSQIPSQGVVNTFATGFVESIGIAGDTSHNIYIADAGSGSVWKFSPAAQ